MNLDEMIRAEMEKPSPLLAYFAEQKPVGLLNRRQKLRGWWYWHVTQRLWQGLHDFARRRGAFCEDD